MGEAVALAHVSRPAVLADAAHSLGYEVVFATDLRNAWVLDGMPFEVLPLRSISSAYFLRAISRGAPLYGHADLSDYVHADLELIRRVKPDLIVGDLRLSLSVSARLTGVVYAAIANAYWSPFSQRTAYVMPPLPRIKALPLPIANALFTLVRPLAFAWHALPLNRVRRRFDLEPIPFDVRHAYTDADYVLYADVPELFPLANAPPTHRFLGPIIWSPPIAPPVWWDQVPRDRPIVYLTLGSSGNADLLPVIVDALATLPIRVVVATAGGQTPRQVTENFFVANYLPGDAASRIAALVVCNGGAPTAQQALAAGVPVLGITSNMDQILNMQAVTRFGAGISLRGERTNGQAIRQAASDLLEHSNYTLAAQKVAALFANYCAKERFGNMLAELLG